MLFYSSHLYICRIDIISYCVGIGYNKRRKLAISPKIPHWWIPIIMVNTKMLFQYRSSMILGCGGQSVGWMDKV